MQRWQCPIYNGTLETIIWPKMWKIISFFVLKKCLFLSISPLLLINKKCASHFRRKTANENKQQQLTLMYNSYLIRQSFWGFGCKSNISISAWRVTWNYAYNPFNRVTCNYAYSPFNRVFRDKQCMQGRHLAVRKIIIKRKIIQTETF